MTCSKATSQWRSQDLKTQICVTPKTLCAHLPSLSLPHYLESVRPNSLRYRTGIMLSTSQMGDRRRRGEPGSEPGTQSGLISQLPTPSTATCQQPTSDPFVTARGGHQVGERKWRKHTETSKYQQRSASPSPQLCPRSGQGVATPEGPKTQRPKGPRRPIKRSEG